MYSILHTTVILGMFAMTYAGPCPAAINPARIYPFGDGEQCAGDSVLPSDDDPFSENQTLAQPFTFYGKNYSTLVVNNNGIISFDKSEPIFTPMEFPILGTAKIAPYWADVDTYDGGSVFYREVTSDAGLLDRATNDIRAAFVDNPSFTANWLYIVTWFEVPFYGANTNGLKKRNTFQVVMVSDESASFVFFNYDRMEWTTGKLAGGSTSTGLGGTAAQVGFDAGDGKSFYIIPGSRTAVILNVTLNGTNINQPGRWAFQVNDVDECTTDTDDCDQTCTNTDGSYICSCKPGHVLNADGITCDDMDECSAATDNCDQTCTNTDGRYSCGCTLGYVLSADGITCDDVDECTTAMDDCNQTCTNTAGSYNCGCNPGYALNTDGITCDIIPSRHSGIACARESQTSELVCGNNERIKITSVTYGPGDGTICSGQPDINCPPAANSLNVVQSTCDGKQSCTVSASNGVFGDPCPYTVKYLQVSYICESHPGLTCADEFQTSEIICASNELIKITAAAYGPGDTTLCPGQSIRNCPTAPNSLNVVQNICDGKTSCTLAAENQVFGDPCPYTPKHLQVSYTCEIIPFRHSGIACAREFHTSEITCRYNEMIKITSAAYGPGDGTVCSGQPDTNCPPAANSLNAVQSICDGKQSCTVFASNGVFGDPCSYTVKYLQVGYTCETR